MLNIDCYFDISEQTPLYLAMWISANGVFPSSCSIFLSTKPASTKFSNYISDWHVQRTSSVCSQFTEAFCLYSLCEGPLRLWHVLCMRSLIYFMETTSQLLPQHIRTECPRFSWRWPYITFLLYLYWKLRTFSNDVNAECSMVILRRTSFSHDLTSRYHIGLIIMNDLALFRSKSLSCCSWLSDSTIIFVQDIIILSVQTITTGALNKKHHMLLQDVY